jgi:NAD(P)-dependent dehydrogenase (short-subunit alcohol dehydrogenase family)
MTVRLDDRVVIITGAGGGLGRTYALNMAKLGAKLVINDPGGAVDGQGGDSSAADKVVKEIKEMGGQAVANYDSVASMEGGTAIVKTAMDTWGRVDALVNNAGILRDKTFIKMPIEDFELVFQVHFMGTVYCTKAAWPIMLEQGYGRIVNTTSVAGLAGGFGQANYGSAKAAMTGFMHVLKLEGQKKGVLANCISPVAADTRMSGSVADPKTADLVTADHVAPAVAWLASENCNVCGEIIGAGGGYFTAVRYYRSEGVMIEGDTPPTVDQFAEQTEKLFNFDNAQPYTGTMVEWMRRMKEAGKL